MECNDLISVVIPNFNNGKYIERCLESVLEQTYDHLEVIVIDDCSTDESSDIIKRYAASDKRIVPVFNTENVGVGSNRHNGIMMSKGRYLTTLDSDDIYISSDKVAREYALMQEKLASGLDNIIIFSRIVLLDANEKKIGLQNPVIKEEKILNDIVRRTCMIPRDFLFTREQYIRAGGFDMKIRIYEDWDLKIRLATENLFFYSGIDGIGYRRHGTGLSAVSPLDHIYWLGRIFIKNFHLLQSERLKTVRVFIRMLWRMLRNYLKKRFVK